MNISMLSMHLSYLSAWCLCLCPCLDLHLILYLPVYLTSTIYLATDLSIYTMVYT